MKPEVLLFVVALSALSTLLPAQDGEHKPITQAEALKAGPEKLVDILGDESEAGLDQAALLYATAKRLETETKLAAKDLLLVQQLDELRGPLTHWQDEIMAIGYISTGGGTMWSHQSARSSAGREDFLATVAAKMPFKVSEEGQPNQVWAAVKKTLQKLQLPKSASEFDPEAKTKWDDQKEKLLQYWEEMDFALSSLSKDQADAVAAYAKQSLDEVIEGMKGL